MDIRTRKGLTWSMCNFSAPKKMYLKFKSDLVSKNLYVGRVIVAFVLAVINGDITIENDTDIGKCKPGITSEIWDCIQVTLKTKDGTIINSNRDFPEDFID